MTLNFTPAEDKIVSLISATGLFKGGVDKFEPDDSPSTTTLTCAVFLNYIGPDPNSSGQATTNGRVVFMARVFSGVMTRPASDIDKIIGHAAARIIQELSADIDLGGNAMYVDLLGATGTPLSAQGGYLQVGSVKYRIMDVTIPIIFNDIWNQGV